MRIQPKKVKSEFRNSLLYASFGQMNKFWSKWNLGYRLRKNHPIMKGEKNESNNGGLIIPFSKFVKTYL